LYWILAARRAVWQSFLRFANCYGSGAWLAGVSTGLGSAVEVGVLA